MIVKLYSSPGIYSFTICDSSLVYSTPSSCCFLLSVSCPGLLTGSNGVSPKHAGKKNPFLRAFVIFILLLILGISLQLLTTCILRLIDTYRPELLTSYHERVQRSFSINNGIIRICTVTLLAPIAEEFAFRGVALKLSISAFHTKHAALCAILFTAFCFGCYHGNVVQFCYSVPAGIILGCLAVWSGSLIPGMILHMILNASSYVIGSIAISASILWGIIGITCILIMICMKLIRRSI